jgi:hypothetical protein
LHFREIHQDVKWQNTYKITKAKSGKKLGAALKDAHDYSLGFNSDSSGLAKYKTVYLGSRLRD